MVGLYAWAVLALVAVADGEVAGPPAVADDAPGPVSGGHYAIDPVRHALERISDGRVETVEVMAPSDPCYPCRDPACYFACRERQLEPVIVFFDDGFTVTEGDRVRQYFHLPEAHPCAICECGSCVLACIEDPGAVEIPRMPGRKRKR